MAQSVYPYFYCKFLGVFPKLFSKLFDSIMNCYPGKKYEKTIFALLYPKNLQ
jgi:hypothetical protein